MINPDTIQVQNNNLPSELKITNVNDFEAEVYNLNDDKDFKKYLTDIERIVRKSVEYKQFINYLRDNLNMNQCAFLKNVSNKETTAIKIELHHYPFSLFDIVTIVFNKRSYYHESLSVFMVAKEVMELHYKLMIGLIPLSETVHELTHNSRLFIPIDKVYGRYQLFMAYYEPFIDPELLDEIAAIEKYTEEHSSIGDTTILDQNTVTYNISDTRYMLPETKIITDKMINQIELIKNNNYMIPNVNDVKMIEEHQSEERKLIKPIIFK